MSSALYPDEDNDQELYSLVNQLQRHSHSASCRKSDKECRFGFPRPISLQTVLSKPPDLKDTLPHLIPVIREHNLKIAGTVNQYIENAENIAEMSCEEDLKDCHIPPKTYQEALSKSSPSPKLHLKREPNAIYINNYNPHLLRAWQAN
jgi:hypothetical protein